MMKRQRDLKRELNKWAYDFKKENGRFPTVLEQIAKAKKLGLKNF